MNGGSCDERGPLFFVSGRIGIGLIGPYRPAKQEYRGRELNIWQTFDETITVPPTANYFVFGINSYQGTTIYVDDCSVVSVSEQTSK